MDNILSASLIRDDLSIEVLYSFMQENVTITFVSEKKSFRKEIHCAAAKPKAMKTFSTTISNQSYGNELPNNPSLLDSFLLMFLLCSWLNFFVAKYVTIACLLCNKSLKKSAFLSHAGLMRSHCLYSSIFRLYLKDLQILIVY